jgi:hypothetical protein
MDCTHNAIENRCPPKGRYANSLRVGYNAFEFVFDFGQAFSEEAQTRSCTRIVTSPGYAKAMIAALQSALEAFERDYGCIGSGSDAATDQNESMAK